MQPFKYEYQSDFARKYYAQGREEGRVTLLLKQLMLRFGPLPLAVEEGVRAAESAALEAIAERVLQARTLEEALG